MRGGEGRYLRITLESMDGDGKHVQKTVVHKVVFSDPANFIFLIEGEYDPLRAIREAGDRVIRAPQKKLKLHIEGSLLALNESGEVATHEVISEDGEFDGD